MNNSISLANILSPSQGQVAKSSSKAAAGEFGVEQNSNSANPTRTDSAGPGDSQGQTNSKPKRFSDALEERIAEKTSKQEKPVEKEDHTDNVAVKNLDGSVLDGSVVATITPVLNTEACSIEVSLEDMPNLASGDVSVLADEVMVAAESVDSESLAGDIVLPTSAAGDSPITEAVANVLENAVTANTTLLKDPAVLVDQGTDNIQPHPNADMPALPVIAIPKESAPVAQTDIASENMPQVSIESASDSNVQAPIAAVTSGVNIEAQKAIPNNGVDISGTSESADTEILKAPEAVSANLGQTVSQNNQQQLTSQNETTELRQADIPESKFQEEEFLLDGNSAEPISSKISGTTGQLLADKLKSQPSAPITQTNSIDSEILISDDPEMDIASTETVSRPSTAQAVSSASPAISSAGPGIATQVSESIQSTFNTTDRQMVIELTPGYLGRIAINFRENADGITGMLQVEKAQTQDQIQRAMPAVIEALESAGIQLKKIEVVLTNQNSHDNASSEQSSTSLDSQNSNSNLNGQSDPQPSGTTDGNYDTQPFNPQIGSDFAQPSSYFDDESVNLLA